jgi:mannose-1-phosphate guanylyltransferase
MSPLYPGSESGSSGVYIIDVTVLSRQVEMNELHAVILAGGRGTRFWPYSSSCRPKQFLDITGEGSMLQLTYRRLARFVSPQKMLVLTVSGMEESITGELPDIPRENIFTEPVGRNTAPSLAVAAALIARRGDDSPMLCCPADHVIGNEEEFESLVRSASGLAAERDALITFGIEPGYPATGYGYIEAGEEVAERNEWSFRKVVNFHEKPDIDRAKMYLEKDTFYWNSGIFLWRPSVFLAAWKEHVPEGIGPLEELEASLGTPSESETIRAAYPCMPSISVDYAILEKADNAIVAPADLDWNDVGSWDALFDLLPADESGNVGKGYVKQIECRGNLLFNPDGAIAAIGLEDTIVVVRGSNVLICKKGDSQKVRDIIDGFEKDGRDDLL